MNLTASRCLTHSIVVSSAGVPSRGQLRSSLCVPIHHGANPNLLPLNSYLRDRKHHTENWYTQTYRCDSNVPTNVMANDSVRAQQVLNAGLGVKSKGNPRKKN